MAAGADVERVKREVEEIIGLDCSDAIQCSAKMVGVYSRQPLPIAR